MNAPIHPWLCLGLALACLGATPASQAQSLTRNPAAAGLWVGEVSLTEVLHPAGGTNAPTADTSQLRLLLHVGQDGEVRLLKDVIVAKRLPTASTNVVLVTNPALLPGMSGLVRQNGRLVAQRIASAAYDFDGTEAVLEGGLGQNFRCEGRLTLSPDHPTNPFLHRYHPDHSTGLPIARTIGIRFLQAPGQFNGIERLVGEYQESITGLQKSAVTIRGNVVLSRVSPHAQLNR